MITLNKKNVKLEFLRLVQVTIFGAHKKFRNKFTDK